MSRYVMRERIPDGFPIYDEDTKKILEVHPTYTDTIVRLIALNSNQVRSHEPPPKAADDRAALVAALRHCLGAIEIMKRDLFEDTKASVASDLAAAREALEGMP